MDMCDECEQPREYCICIVDFLPELEAYRRLIRYWHVRDGSNDIDRDVLCDLEHVYQTFHEGK